MDEAMNEITELKERMVRVETMLEGIQRSVEKDKNTGGAVVIPVAAVVAVVEVIKILLERMA